MFLNCVKQNYKHYLVPTLFVILFDATVGEFILILSYICINN